MALNWKIAGRVHNLLAGLRVINRRGAAAALLPAPDRLCSWNGTGPAHAADDHLENRRYSPPLSPLSRLLPDRPGHQSRLGHLESTPIPPAKQ